MRKTIVDVIREILATCTKSVGYGKVFFRNVLNAQHRWNDGYRSHEIYFRYDTRYIIDRWNLDVSSIRSRRWSETRATF